MFFLSLLFVVSTFKMPREEIVVCKKYLKINEM